ncbi:hypothetical protein KJ762_09910 [bacterium]|nr:hypothetical protein [bacterium]MBU1634809.1 hypothetical protein [bacterium]MBU1872828.1 hypothetical protein [bacterium]
MAILNKSSDSHLIKINSILDEFIRMNIDESPPSLEEIISKIRMISSNIQHKNSILIDTIEALEMEKTTGSNVYSSSVKILLYSCGVLLFQLSITREIPADNINYALTILEWSIKIDKGYYQAYNRLGDCWMRIKDGFSVAISCFKASLHYSIHGTRSSIEMFSGSHSGSYSDAFKGDNYLKIGLCLLKLNRKNDARLFITEAKSIVSDDYQGFTEIGFSNWDEVFELLEDYDYEKDQSKENQKGQNKEILSEEISKAIESKRGGDFESANKISNIEIKAFTPDYRDTILYNGADIYIATGRIINDKIEFQKESNQNDLILLNTNLSAEKYIEYHTQYDIIRNKDCKDFEHQEIFINKNDIHGRYVPTGRIFHGDENIISWEMMKKNEPDDVFYTLIPISGEDTIVGLDALKQKVIPTIKIIDFSEEDIDEWNETAKLAVAAKRIGNYHESLKIWDDFEKKHPAMNPRLSASKGKVLILLGKLEDAKKEFMKCISYFVKYEKSILNSDDEQTKKNCISAIKHIGFCVGNWDDANEYLNDISGKGYNPDFYNTQQRILSGLKTVNNNGFWCDHFDKMKSVAETCVKFLRATKKKGMPIQYEDVINLQMLHLAVMAKALFKCNILPHEVKNVEEYKTDLILSLLLDELHFTLEQLLNSGRKAYICCLPVEIDHWDYLVTPMHKTLTEEEVFAKAKNNPHRDYFSDTADESVNNVSDWQFEAWLEEILQTEVLSIGSIKQDGKRFRTFRWITQ